MKKINPKKVRMFKIRNRKGYAAICMNNLTEGATVTQAYDRMIKALKRNKIELEKLEAAKLRKLLTSL